eukprot:SAG22_NODE_1011_length_6041_cov_11.536856_4_plen_321_part_00
MSFLAAFDTEEMIGCIKELVRLDEDWIPHATCSTTGTSTGSLYLRPTLISTHSQLGLNAPSRALLYVIASPVGAYFPTTTSGEGGGGGGGGRSGGGKTVDHASRRDDSSTPAGCELQPIKLLAAAKYTRAFPGGTGAAKTGGNYGQGIAAEMEARLAGCAQNLWLYGDNDQVTEAGTMNLFFLWKMPDYDDDGNGGGSGDHLELVTAPLADDLILPGVTRDTVLHLAKTLHPNIKVSERAFTMADVISAVSNKPGCNGTHRFCTVAACALLRHPIVLRNSMLVCVCHARSRRGGFWSASEPAPPASSSPSLPFPTVGGST